MSVNLAAAPNQPVDTVANCENRKASASNRPGGSMGSRLMAGRVTAIPFAIAG